MKYRVIDPRGIAVNGAHHAAGSVVKIPPGAAEKAFVHFKQVEPAEAAEAKAKAEAEARAAVEAEAKAKAAAEAKAKEDASKAAPPPVEPQAKPKK